MRWCLLVVVVAFLGTAAPAYAKVDANPDGLSFAQDVGDGPSPVQSSVVTNNTAFPVPLSVADPAKPEFQLLKDDSIGDCSQRHGLFPGDSCRVRVRFDPSAEGTITDSVVVNDGADDTPVQLSGTGTVRHLTPSPASIDFGQQPIEAGSTAPQTATFTNDGTGPVTFTGAAAVTGPDASQFQLGSSTCTGTLAAGGSCTVDVAFDPSTFGDKSAQLGVPSNAPAVQVELTGTGIQLKPRLALDVPATLDLGVLKVGAGKTALESSKVANVGTDPITLNSIRLRDPESARFLWASGLSGDCAAGRTLAAGESCDLRVRYVPQGDGTKTGTMTVDSTAGVKTLLLTAAGTPGLRIPAFSVRASKVRNHRLTVVVTPVGGTVSNIAVRIRSSSGAVVGSGTLTRAAAERAVTIRLRSTLSPGRYVATAGGRDLFAGIVTAAPRPFSVR
jgi:hypothetical protein